MCSSDLLSDKQACTTEGALTQPAGMDRDPNAAYLLDRTRVVQLAACIALGVSSGFQSPCRLDQAAELVLKDYRIMTIDDSIGPPAESGKRA